MGIRARRALARLSLARLAAALALVALGAACSVFANGTTEISITTNPSGAAVEVNGVKVGESPIVYTVKSSESLEIVVTKAGYETQHAATGTGLTTYGVLDAVGACIWLVPLIGLWFPGAWSQSQSVFDLTLKPAAP